VVNGIIDEDDARALNAPLLDQREQARLSRAALPSAAPLPTVEQIDPDAFRAAVLEAWHDRPLEDRRRALDKVVDEVRLSPGGVHIRYGASGYHGHAPPGPPYGAWVRWEVEVAVPDLRRPRARTQDRGPCRPGR